MAAGFDVHRQNAIREILEYGGNQDRELIRPLLLSLAPQLQNPGVQFDDGHHR